MVGGNDLSQYLINFNASDWANQANAHLQSALGQGLAYSEKNAQQAVNAIQGYDQKAQQQMQQGFDRGQALNAPQRLAAYGALDAYQDTLGLARPVGGSFQLASALENNLMGQSNAPIQNQQAMGFNQGLLAAPIQKPQGGY
jgi:hypothetical protein